MINTEILITVIFSINTLIFLAISYLMVKSRNGGLKIEFLAFFIACGWASLLRVFFPLLLGFMTQNAVSLLVGLPVMITGGHLVLFLFSKYRSKSGSGNPQREFIG
jgi:hypothetical protein